MANSKDVFNTIKKQNGERFAKTLRDYHNGILEIPNIVEIVKFAGKGVEDAESILKYLISLLNEEKGDKSVKESPYALLDKAGYDAYFADTLEKQDAISKYFKENEKLCTFKSNRYMSHYIINAVRKDVDNIKREDFVGKEERQDEYGTSVLSIQVARKGGFVSIKNRYNHTVSGCDNTFNSNPDNIIPGLSAAIQQEFGVSFKVQSTLPDNVSLVGQQLVRWHLEINGIYIGDKWYIKNGNLVEVRADQGEFLFDYFIFSMKTKQFRVVDYSIVDSFAEDFNRAYAGCDLSVKKGSLYEGNKLIVGVG